MILFSNCNNVVDPEVLQIFNVNARVILLSFSNPWVGNVRRGIAAYYQSKETFS